MTEPEVVMVKRYRCPFCRRSGSGKSAITAHIGRCWLNPANRSCKTCFSLDPGGDACGCVPGCNWGSPSGSIPPSCDAGVDLRDREMPVTACPLWKLREAVA